MNVSFKMFEKLGNGFVITSQNGLTEFIAENKEIMIVFHTVAGEGKNYSKIIRYLDKNTGKQYKAMRYLHKYVSLVQGFSNQLFMKYQAENNK